MLNYKILADSCMDPTPEQKADPRIELIPLTLQVGDTSIRDDETFDQKEFLRLVAESDEVAKSACPSPEAYMRAIAESDADCVFIITLSQHLSGSYNAAILGQNLYREEYEDSTKKIHVFSSDSASAGETVLVEKITELVASGMDFDQIVSEMDRFRTKDLKTFFVLDDMEALRKNGRLTGLTAVLVTALNIRPIMVGVGGKIARFDQASGTKKALLKMAQAIVSDLGDETKERDLVISHCNCPERAAGLRETFESMAQFRSIQVVPTAGVSSLYACDGGIVVAC